MIMRAPFVRPSIANAVAVLTLALGAAPGHTAGFQINETSASGLGNAFAGGAAAAEDATTLWSNVAGMSQIRTRQGVAAIHLVTPSMKFRNEASVAAAAQALGGDGGDAGGVNVVPNLYLVAPIDKDWSIGLGVNAPFGLVTEYDNGWIGRFQAIKSSIETINVNPGVSWKPANNVALGLGLNFQRIEAEFTNQVNYAGALLTAAAQAGVPLAPATVFGLESSARVEGSDNAWGWNAGVLWSLDDNTRIGAHYRSSIDYNISGSVKFANPAVPPPLAGLAGAVNTLVLFDSDITSDVKLPAIFNLSYFRMLDSRWDVMADAQWTKWASIQNLTFVRSNGSVLQSTPENFRDTWKVAIGANYRYNSEWMWRGGLALDQSPVKTEFRTPRLPDADRTWLTGGVQYKMGPNFKFDFGAAYVWVKEASININGSPPSTAAYGLLNGKYTSNTVIASGQVSYSF